MFTSLWTEQEVGLEEGGDSGEEWKLGARCHFLLMSSPIALTILDPCPWAGDVHASLRSILTSLEGLPSLLPLTHKAQTKGQRSSELSSGHGGQFSGRVGSPPRLPGSRAPTLPRLASRGLHDPAAAAAVPNMAGLLLPSQPIHWAAHCHCGLQRWRCEVSTGCAVRIMCSGADVGAWTLLLKEELGSGDLSPATWWQ